MLILNHQIFCEIFYFYYAICHPERSLRISYEELKWLIEILHFVQNDKIRKEISKPYLSDKSEQALAMKGLIILIVFCVPQTTD